MPGIRLLLLAAVSVVLLSVLAPPTAAADLQLPAELEGWDDWVLADEPWRRCPWLTTSRPGTRAAHRCAWPGELRLDVDARGVRFTQRWRLEAPGWVELPGNLEHWPANVTVNGIEAPIVARAAKPQLRLPVGVHDVSGRISWEHRPELLPVPETTGLVALVVDGAAVPAAERSGGSARLAARGRQDSAELVELRVHRLLEDAIPARLTTRITLDVSGAGRELAFEHVLPEGYRPLAIRAALPVRVDADGTLRVQARAGSWWVELDARGPGVAAGLRRPSAADGWPAQEIWSFRSNDRLRVAAVEGAEAVQPATAGVPADWQDLPAFRVGEDTVVDVVEHARGLAAGEGNNLRVSRQIWLDFDGEGYTTVDALSGTMRADWRLDMRAPWSLAAAQLDFEPLLVTTGAQGTGGGIEVRMPELEDLEAVARAPRDELPASGWATRVEQATGTLVLPAGHRLLAAPGTDYAPGAWVAQWGLWNVFGVLVVVVLIGWLAGRAIAAAALVAFALTYLEAPMLIWLWANVLAAIAIARSLPEGRLSRWALRYRTLAFVLLALALLPFFWSQARLAFYPQLAAASASSMPAITLPAGYAAPEAERMPEVARAMPAPRQPSAMEDASNRPLEIIVTARKRDEAVTSPYEQGTLLQAGPGVPRWDYGSYAFGWNGPVEPSQTVRFIIAAPWLMSLWRIAGVLLLAGVYVWLLAAATRRPLPRVPANWQPRLRGATPAALLAVAAIVGCGALPAVAVAASTPDGDVLKELERRLEQPPACMPDCAALREARVAIDGERLTIDLSTSALASLAMPLPHGAGSWRIDELRGPDGAAMPLLREGDGGLWAALPRGAKTLRLGGRLEQRDAVQLVFPFAPRLVTIDAPGWTASGLEGRRLTAGTLVLTRDGAAAGNVRVGSGDFSPFVRVTRRVALDTEWTVETLVERIAPDARAFTIAIPTLAGESVLTPEIARDRDGRVLASFDAGAQAVSWRSSLARAETLRLSLEPGDDGASAARTETWQFGVLPQWHVAFDGVPATLPEDVEDGRPWLFEFHPRAGETLDVAVTRPAAVPGTTLAIDGVEQRYTFGRRATDVALELDYRSTQGGRHAIALPADLRVTEVTIDHEPVALRPVGGELVLALLPGEYHVGIKGTLAEGVALRSGAAAIDLRAPASNVRTLVELSRDRWVLFGSGQGVGPAFVYWGELVVFVLLAFALARAPGSPLKLHEWLLLGLGLSTLSWFVFALVALWLYAMRWRAGWSGGSSRWRFNGVQVALAAFTAIALFALLFAGIRDGLLATPDMGIAGYGSVPERLSWFVDRTEAALPTPSVYSVPLWIYRVLVFAWALWIAFAVVRWTREAWRSWTAGGYWRNRGAAT